MHRDQITYMKEDANFHKLLLVVVFPLGKQGLPFAPQQVTLEFQGVCMVICNVLETQNF